MRRRLLWLTTAALAVTAMAFAQGPPPDGAQDRDAENDPPSRAARLSFIGGTVSFQPGSVEDWIPATLNRPLTTGDRLWTEVGARAEMHIGRVALRLNGRGT